MLLAELLSCSELVLGERRDKGVYVGLDVVLYRKALGPNAEESKVSELGLGSWSVLGK